MPRIRDLLKPALLSSARYLVPVPLARLCHGLVYVSEFSRWRAAHRSRHRFSDRYQLYQHVLQTEGADTALDYLEFGVSAGESLQWWLEGIAHPDARFYGFDTFTGLPESWGHLPQGSYSTAGQVPEVDDTRCRFLVGLFQETLPDFLAQTPLDRRKIVHLDADLYSSTLFVLATLAPVLRPGDLLLFDEFGSLRMATHEYRAFADFTHAFSLSYELVGSAFYERHLALKILVDQ